MSASAKKNDSDEAVSNSDTIIAISYNDLSRRDVRSIIFHLLYAMECFDYQTSLDEIIDNFNRGFALDIPHVSEASNVARKIIETRSELDECFKPFLINWRFERIGTCTKLILRFAIWELQHTDAPHNIIINEAIELAKCFSETDAYKFINGILDEAVKTIRPDEKLAEEAQFSSTTDIDSPDE
jgi:N utilization substance protein B